MGIFWRPVILKIKIVCTGIGSNHINSRVMGSELSIIELFNLFMN